MAKQPTTPSEAARLSQEAYKAAKANLDTITYAMSQKTASIFHETVAKARVRVNEVGEKAMAEAVQELAAQGIYASSHTDKNGRGYRVPADVAVRQAVYTSGRQRFNGHVLGVAQRTGQDLIEVSSTPNCRPSHEVINGKIFSISGQDRRYPKWTADLEALTHDYNCGHSVAIYHEGMERVFSDPLEGTGYSVEEARKAYAKQRRYENQIRKQKRTVEALKAAGLETREANAQLNALRRRLKKHIEDNSAILRRERHREQLYDSAQRMKKKLVKRPRLTLRLGVGKGGSASQTLKAVIKIDANDKSAINNVVKKAMEAIRNVEVEHAVIIASSGVVYHGVGDAVSVGLDESLLEKSTVVHNHPLQYGESVSFGADDFEALKKGEIAYMVAVSRHYTYEVRVIKPIDISYNEAYRNGVDPFGDRDQQHNVMEWLARNGYIEYKRTRVRG